MKKTPAVLLTLALLVALTLPVAALAKRGGGNSSTQANRGQSHRVVSKSHARGLEKHQAAAVRKADKTAEKVARKLAKGPKGQAPAGSYSSGESTGTTDASAESSSTESTPTSLTVGAGILNAFGRITANLEKSLAKMAAGTKKQLPPGLVRVWLKFASWLGIDSAGLPGTPPVQGSDDTSGSVVPSSTIEPTGTVEPSSTIEPSSTVDASSTDAAL